MLFVTVMRWLALCVLALGALGVHARAMQNAPLEKIASLNADCAPARAAQALDSTQKNSLDYGGCTSWGIYMGVDPKGFDPNNIHSFNRYAYANNNPYKYIDPDGKNAVLVSRAVYVASFEAATALGAATLGYWLADKAWGIMHSESDAAPAAGEKRGPKTDPNAPHNTKIRDEAGNLKDEGNRIVAGGGEEKEQLVKTPGGVKSGRRPDIIYETPEGERRGRNIGRTKADGSPVPREVDALNDLNGPGKLPTDFKPYDR